MKSTCSFSTSSHTIHLAIRHPLLFRTPPPPLSLDQKTKNNTRATTMYLSIAAVIKKNFFEIEQASGCYSRCPDVHALKIQEILIQQHQRNSKNHSPIAIESAAGSIKPKLGTFLPLCFSFNLQPSTNLLLFDSFSLLVCIPIHPSMHTKTHIHVIYIPFGGNLNQ